VSRFCGYLALFSVACFFLVLLPWVFSGPAIISALIYEISSLRMVLPACSEGTVALTNFQSIFQLGAALCLALTAAGPRLVELFAGKMTILQSTQQAAVSLAPQVGGTAGDNLAIRGKILDFLGRYIQKEILRIQAANPHQLGYYSVLSVINVVLLVFVTMVDCKISYGTGVLISVFSLVPPILVPVQAFVNLRRLDNYVSPILNKVRFIEPSNDDREALLAILHEVAHRAI